MAASRISCRRATPLAYAPRDRAVFGALSAMSAIVEHQRPNTSMRMFLLWWFCTSRVQTSPTPSRKKDNVALPVASVQLYTLAEQFSADMSGSLDRLAAIGLKNVEAF